MCEGVMKLYFNIIAEKKKVPDRFSFNIWLPYCIIILEYW